MKVTEQDVLYVAELANLELTEAERARMVKDLNAILDHIDVLSRLDTTSVEPMAQTLALRAANGEAGSSRFAYAMRDDQTRPSLARKTVMNNAPETDGTFFKVPKVIER